MTSRTRLCYGRYARCHPQLTYYHHDSVLFAIDCGLSMHHGSDDELEPPLLTALRAALRLMEIKLVSAPKDHVGILLWNTVCSLTNAGGLAHDDRDEAWLLAPLGRIRPFAAGQCARHIPATSVDPMYVGCLLISALEKDPQHLHGDLSPVAAQMPMEHVFANALRLLAASVKAGTRRVFFVTNQDDPHPGSKKPLMQKACIDAMKVRARA